MQGLNDNVAGNKGVIVGRSKVSTQADDPNSVKESGISKNNCVNSGIVALEFTSLGYSKLRPGIVYFGGIGLRYSGEYNIISITHTIDINGYGCRGTATTGAIYGKSGISIPDAIPGQNDSLEVGLFKPKLSMITDPGKIGLPGISPSTFGIGNAMDEYSKKVLS